MALTKSEKLEDLATLKQILASYYVDNNTIGIKPKDLFICNIVDGEESIRFHTGFLRFLQNQLRLIDSKYSDLYDTTSLSRKGLLVKDSFKRCHGVWSNREYRLRVEFIDRVITTLKQL